MFINLIGSSRIKYFSFEKKRWLEYMEKLHKKYLNDPDNHEGVITYLESDIQSQVGLRKHLYE